MPISETQLLVASLVAIPFLLVLVWLVQKLPGPDKKKYEVVDEFMAKIQILK